MPCGAVLCRALQSVVFRAYQSTTLASIQSWPEPAYCRVCYTAVLSLYFPFFSMGLFLCCTGIQQQQYSSSTYEYVVVQYQNREHTEQQSTTQHCAITPAQSSKPSTCRSEYASKEECTYMHASSGLFSWSMELLVFASRLFAPKMLHHLINTFACHFNPLFLVIERDVRNRPLREAPCTTYIYIPRTNLATYIPPANLPTSRFNSRRASRQTRPSHNHTRTLCFRLLASDLV